MGYRPLSKRERGELWMRLGIRAILITAAGLLIVYVVPPVVSLAAPFFPALAVAWLLNSPVRWLQRKLGFSRKTISFFLLLLILCLLGSGVYGLLHLASDQARTLAENWPELVAEAREAVDTAVNWLSRFLPPGVLKGSGALFDRLGEWDFAGSMTRLAGKAPSLVSGVSGFAVAAVVFVMASFLITGDYPRLRFLLADRMAPDVRRFCASIKTLFFSAFGGYLKSQLLLSLGVFMILAVGLFAIRQPYGLLLAAGLAVLDFIPIVGAGTVMVPWAVVCFISGQWQRSVGLLAVWALTAVFRRVAEPKVLGSQTGLSPILSLVGIYVGMKLAGVLGMILGPVVLLVLSNLGRKGIFKPTAADLRMAFRDVQGLLRADGGHSE